MGGKGVRERTSSSAGPEIPPSQRPREPNLTPAQRNTSTGTSSTTLISKTEKIGPSKYETQLCRDRPFGPLHRLTVPHGPTVWSPKQRRGNTTSPDKVFQDGLYAFSLVPRPTWGSKMSTPLTPGPSPTLRGSSITTTNCPGPSLEQGTVRRHRFTGVTVPPTHCRSGGSRTSPRPVPVSRSRQTPFLR